MKLPFQRAICNRWNLLFSGSSVPFYLLFYLLSIGSIFPAESSAPTDSARPTPLAPWSLHLLASSPEIRHPSVVCTAPDGRIFVAEDPMDISAPANAPHGRIIAFHPDGRRTVFATNLFAVFGLQYLEGKLYVLHNPKFTAYRDSGDTGTQPEDLIASTNPNPWALDWNDHVPANFRLAMDGYFYMAVGDKGIYGATGSDGRKVFLHGGGILRLRPDGSGMEVYSTGVRNILDVALTSDDEIFTYDNTDEHDWMGRLTHMVDGGFYGYPHDFIPQRPYTLWMMHDFGGGAATGTFAYTEDALPADFQDNLFLADFGKRQVIRVVIAREGATFKVVRHEELFSDIPDDFRPVGIAPSADGKSILICDWQHRDTKESVEVGRLWKLTYSGNTIEKGKPTWYLPTALGQKSPASNDSLFSALSHPSKNVRLTAQRELARRGPIAARIVSDVLPTLQPPAAWHALWTLDKLNGDRNRQVFRLAHNSNLSVRRQFFRWLAQRGDRADAATLAEALRDPDASIRFQAANALGRLAVGLDPLLATLNDPDLFTRHAKVKALNRLATANPAAWPAIVQQLNSTNAALRQEITHVFRETYDPALAQSLIALARKRDAPEFARAGALTSLASITRKLPEWKGEWWAYHPALAPAPVRTESWSATEPALAALSDVLQHEPALRLATVHAVTDAHETSLAPTLRALYDEDARTPVREAILLALARFKDTNAAPLVASALTASSPELLRAALAAARVASSPQVVTNLAALVSNTSLPPDLRAEIIKTAGHLRITAARDHVTTATQSSDLKIRSAAIDALGKIGGPTAAKTLLSLFELPDPDAHRLAASALGELKDTNSVPKLLSVYSQETTREAALDALLRIPDLSAVDVYIDALGNANPTTRERARKILEPFRQNALGAVRSRVDTLRPIQIAELQKIYPEERDLTLISTTRNVIPTAAEYVDFGLKNKGDAFRGRRLFYDQSGVACIKCHTVAGEGNAVGPDMTTIGAQFPRIALIEHIINPSQSVREGYAQVLIDTSDDESFAGLIKSETADTLTILDAQAKLQTIPKSKITSRHASQLSLMPDGLHLGLTLEQFADLLAYLESLKTDPRKK